MENGDLQQIEESSTRGRARAVHAEHLAGLSSASWASSDRPAASPVLQPGVEESSGDLLSPLGVTRVHHLQRAGHHLGSPRHGSGPSTWAGGVIRRPVITLGVIPGQSPSASRASSDRPAAAPVLRPGLEESSGDLSSSRRPITVGELGVIRSPRGGSGSQPGPEEPSGDLSSPSG